MSKSQVVDRPTLNILLSKKDIVALACGEANYAVAKNGDLYAWGLLDGKVLKNPVNIAKKTELDSIASSKTGYSAGVDKYNRLWV